MTVYYQDGSVTLYHDNALDAAENLPDQSVDCIVTSPPYFGLRDYGIEGQYGLEDSPAEYVETMRVLFSELHSVLADDGTLWLNLGDSYSRNPMKGGTGTPNGRNVPEMGYPNRAKWREGAARADGQVRSDGASRRNRNGCLNGDLPEKNLLGIPWRVALALQNDGWILRNAIIWHKPNGMPDPVADRLRNSYEHVFLFVKQARYAFNLDAIRVEAKDWSKRGPGVGIALTDHYGSGNGGNGGLSKLAQRYKDGTASATKNPGDVWTIPTQPFAEAHFAVMPLKLAQQCIEAGCKPGGTVLDPFSGSGTTGLAAQRLGRKYVGVDLNADYLKLSLETRLRNQALDFGEGA